MISKTQVHSTRLGTLLCVLSDAADSKSSRLERESEWGRGGSEGGREARDLFPGMINDVSGDLDRYAHGDRCKKRRRRRNGPFPATIFVASNWSRMKERKGIQ